MPKGTPNADWKGQVLSEIIRQLEDFRKQGFPPTLRGMIYTLYCRPSNLSENRKCLSFA